MLVLFYFLAASPTSKNVAVRLFAIVPLPLRASGAAAAIPRRNSTRFETSLRIRKMLNEFSARLLVLKTN
jgi:hypothetical protein